MDRFDTVVIGGGQAGLAMGYLLRNGGRRCVVLERGRIGETWRSQRWDSFAVNTPNWTTSLPGAPYEGPSHDGFATRDEWVSYLESYATRFEIPVRTDVEVVSVRPGEGGVGYVVSTRNGTGDPIGLATMSVVVASGIMNVPKIPSLSRDFPDDVHQLHTADYRSPQALPEGSVVVVGAAQSGCQIAEDLLGSSREVYLCTSQVARVPRRHRGRDIVSWWLDMGVWDVEVDELEDPAIVRAPQPQVSGVGPLGHTVSLQQLARDGVRLMGRLIGVEDGVMITDDKLGEYMSFADERSRQFKSDIETHIAAGHIEAPSSEPDPADVPFVGQTPAGSLERLDLHQAGVGAVIWCTGFTANFDWLQLPVLDGAGQPVHRRGIAPIPGVYFVGFPWLHKRKSGVILGVEEDARFVAEAIEQYLG